ncbi:hypothetical protein F4821DRAFT_258134 [Hypoxylon rubiginosum]|uniref:Uncharacterized protein n=1 Tax=Hypoxylon rubiginosum TaxID=110542 RepID=A0ACC0D6X3_9PEZI|nr:hypothetical protein F4821DRAFT_258134 [Hypoxylon rubiginosum]
MASGNNGQRNVTFAPGQHSAPPTSAATARAGNNPGHNNNGNNGNRSGNHIQFADPAADGINFRGHAHSGPPPRYHSPPPSYTSERPPPPPRNSEQPPPPYTSERPPPYSRHPPPTPVSSNYTSGWVHRRPAECPRVGGYRVVQ